MLEELKILFIVNKNEIFVILFVTFLGVIGFLIRRYFFKNKETPRISKVNKGVIAIGGSNTINNYGITLEEYKQGLERREQEVRKELNHAHDEEKQQLQIALTEIQAKQGNLQQSYEKYIAELQQRITELEKFQPDTDNPQLFSEAINALKQGKNNAANDLFAQIEQKSEGTIKIVAEAVFQRANIAENEIRYADALKYYQKAHHLAPENTLYLTQLGLIYHTLGKYKKAIEYYELALKSDLETYGEDHPDVARDRNNLGGAWHSLEQYEKAIGYYELALKSDLKTYGEDHSDVAIDRNNLGSAWYSLGKYEKAIGYYELALKSDLKTYGEDHPDVAIDHNNLGSAWKSLGKYKKAIGYYELALKSDLKTYGKNHPTVAIRLNNLGGAWHSLEQYEKAIEYYELALKSDLKTYGEDHPQVATYRNNLGGAWQELGEYGKAIAYFELALESDLKTYGENHPSVARDRSNLGSACYSLGKYEKAIGYFELALKSDLKTYGKDHPIVVTHRNNLARAKNMLTNKTK
ncbi:hypothetical protein [uncultured Gammaproteobacteria bacterium]|nr:hypothetical protein [uncultured Gammaproteobacteria bacterium]